MRGALRETGRRSGQDKLSISDHSKTLTEEARHDGLVRSANCDPHSDRRGPDGVLLASRTSLKPASFVMLAGSEWQLLSEVTMSERNVLLIAHRCRPEQAVEFFPPPGAIVVRRVNTLSFGCCPSMTLFLNTASKMKQTGMSA